MRSNPSSRLRELCRQVRDHLRGPPPIRHDAVRRQADQVLELLAFPMEPYTTMLALSVLSECDSVLNAKPRS